MPNYAPTDDSIRTANTADAVGGYTNEDSSFPLRDNNTTNEDYLHYSHTFFLGKTWLKPRFGQIRLRRTCVAGKRNTQQSNTRLAFAVDNMRSNRSNRGPINNMDLYLLRKFCMLDSCRYVRLVNVRCMYVCNNISNSGRYYVVASIKQFLIEIS